MTDFSGEIHPFAEAFPMLPDDERAALTEDVKANGLRQPIVLDANGRLVDGRNRLAACTDAGIAPEFVTLPEGTDPVAFIVSTNLKRRDLSKGQRAMVAARMRLIKKISIPAAAASAGVSQGQAGHAAIVLEHRSDLAAQVDAGSLPLNEAYRQAQETKQAAESDEKKLAELRDQAPDLAALVADEQMTIGEAHAAMKERQRLAQEKRRDAHTLLTRVVDLVAPVNADPTFAKEWADNLGETDTAQINRIDSAIHVLTDLRENLA